MTHDLPISPDSLVVVLVTSLSVERRELPREGLLLAPRSGVLLHDDPWRSRGDWFQRRTSSSVLDEGNAPTNLRDEEGSYHSG